MKFRRLTNVVDYFVAAVLKRTDLKEFNYDFVWYAFFLLCLYILCLNVFTARAMLCAVYAMAVCLSVSVCLCVCHKSVFY